MSESSNNVHTEEGAASVEWIFNRPKHGWVCFHCGEICRTPGEARDHFGHDPRATPACRIKVGEERGLVMALRAAEAERDEYKVRYAALMLGASVSEEDALVRALRERREWYAQPVLKKETA